MLAPGTRLGVYEITAPIGAGGMGEVYRARDTKLNRDIALKVLPDSFATDPDRLARFTREAQTLALLNHPNIAQIYGLEGLDRLDGPAGIAALVMELVDGEELAQRIARGPLPVADALLIAKQLAEALEAAHEQGIIHRDLKPANIKVRDDGTVKVLDFGLAKAVEPASGSGGSGGLSMSPTLTTPAVMTGMGVILGTAAYMSPEQAKGRNADKRSDVWAFGCVFYEMLTGRRAFEGEDMTDTIAAVVRGEPDWTALPSGVPASIVTLIKRCLDKDRKTRIGDIAAARFVLSDPATTAPAAPVAVQAVVVAKPNAWRRAGSLAATAVVTGAIVAGAAWALRPQPAVPPVVRFPIVLDDRQQLTNNNSQSLGISPDGTRIAYVANRQVWVRSLSDLESRPLTSTQAQDAGTTLSHPTFSPDGQSIVFVSQTDRMIKRVSVTGGAAATVCSIADARLSGMSWDGRDLIFTDAPKGILRVPASGGQPATIASVKAGEFVTSPQALPGGDWILFTVATSATADGWDNAHIVAQSTKTSERKTLVSGGSWGQYVPSGHIVYAVGGVLFAVPFDLRRLTVTGGPVSVVEGVRRSNNGSTGTAYYAVSATGSMVYWPGSVSASAGTFDLAFVDRSTGVVQPLKLPPARYEHPRLSPDGKWIAVVNDDGRNAIVGIVDVSGAAATRRLTLTGRSRFPVWSPDGQYLVFQSDREGDLGIWRQRADGTAPAERLTKPDKDTAHQPETWSPDGKTLLFSVVKGAAFTLAALSMPDRKVTPFGAIESTIVFSAAFSPDGKWVAYEARDSSTTSNPLFVQPFPPTGATYQVAPNGVHAFWSADGKELFFGPNGGLLSATTITTRPAFSFGNPTTMNLSHVDSGPNIERNNDITHDGKRFLIVLGQQAAATTGTRPTIQVVLNWGEELKQRVAAR